MPNFKLTFSLLFNAGHDTAWTGTYTRVIVADSLEIATLIGNGMRGDFVGSHEWLGTLESIEVTNEEPNLGSWDQEGTWKNILESMGLGPDSVRFVFHNGCKVGIAFV